MGAIPSATLAALAATARLRELDKWETVKDALKRGDRQGAIAEISRVLAEAKSKRMIEAAGKQAREDALFQVLELAALDERPLLSTVFGIRSSDPIPRVGLAT